MIKIYGTTGCPMCSYVKQKLTPLKVDFEYVTDEEIMAEKNILHVPVLEMEDGTMLHGKEILDYVAELEGKQDG
jgi:glutaredoxin